MTDLTLSHVEHLEISINIIANNEVQPSKMITKIYDTLKESISADYNVELQTDPQWSIKVVDKNAQEINNLHIVLFDLACHFLLRGTGASKSWLDVCSSFADKMVLLLNTYNFSSKNIEIECSFDIDEPFILLESLINETELNKLVSNLNMALTPISLMFLSAFSGWDTVIIAPKREPKSKEKDLPINIILHKDLAKYQEGILTDVYQTTIALENKLHALKGDGED